MIVEDCKIKRKKRTLKEDVGGEFFWMERCDTVAAKRTGRQKGGRREEGLREGGARRGT